MSQRQMARRSGIHRLWTRRVRLSFDILEDRSMPSATLPVDLTSPYGGGWEETRILVQYKPEFVNQVSSLSGTELGQSFTLLPGLFEVYLSPGVSVEQALAAYKADNRVLYAQPDFKIQLSAIPNDPSFGSLWGLHNTGQSGGTVDADIDAPEAWDIRTSANGIIVGVIDTGVDYNHPDLNANMWRNLADPIDGLDNDGNGYVDDRYGINAITNNGNPMDDNNHGTHCAGTIGAVGNNGIGVAGVAWSVQIMGLKFLSANGSGSTSDAIQCINYAVSKGVKVLSNSWGGGGYDAALYNAIVAARNAGVIFVAAAGNNGANNDTGTFYPANYNVNNVVSVAATDRNNNLASFSNYGATSVELGAPGVSILSTTRNNTYSSYSGTSMATPHVAGAMALVWANNPTLTYLQVIDQVLSNVDPLPSLAGKTITGGRLNVFKAMGGLPPVDSSGPRVTSAVWVGSGNNVNQLRLTFNEAVTAGSFATGDVVTFTGPGGTNLLSQVTSVTGSGTTWTVNFNAQTVPGGYSMTVGPDIRDAANNQMNQNANMVNGEIPGDRYTTAHTLDSTYTYTSTDVPKPISDFTTAISVLNVPTNLTIGDINVKFYITHTYDADLRIRLRSPFGTLLTLAQYRGGSGDNFGNSVTYTTMDDEAAAAISSGTAPFVGSYRPEVSYELSRLDARNAQGTWRLEIYDRANLDTGMLRGWQLVITPALGGGGGGFGGLSHDDADAKPVDPLALLGDTERSLSFVSAISTSGEPSADEPDVPTPLSTDVRTVNRVFAEAVTSSVRRQRSASDPLSLLHEEQADLLPL